MAMLAEPRQRKRYNLVPRGKALYEDDSRFGTKMLEKMGWSKGKGLGPKEDGSQDFVRVRYKNDIQGLGFEQRDDQWTQHENGFSSLLNSLNGDNSVEKEQQFHHCSETEDEVPRMGFGFQNNDNQKVHIKKEKKPKLKEKISGVSLEEKSKQSKARVHYKKFTKGKDLSQYSEKDLANIFGVKAVNDIEAADAKLNKNLNENDAKTEEEKPGTENFAGFKMISTGVSVSDYFKKKMEALKNRTSLSHPPEVEDSEQQPEIAQGYKDSISKKKKSKRDRSADVDILEPTETEHPIDQTSCYKDNDDAKQKKKERKNKKEGGDAKEKYKEDKLVLQNEMVASDTHKKKKKKRSRGQMLVDEPAEVTGEAGASCSTLLPKTPTANELNRITNVQENKMPADEMQTEEKTLTDVVNADKDRKKSKRLCPESEIQHESVIGHIPKKIKRKAVSAPKEVTDNGNVNDLQAKLTSFNVYRISSFCAEKFRNLNLSYFPNSSLAQIEGYALNQNLQLKIELNKTDEMRITRLWDNTISKYALVEKKTRNAYHKYVKETFKAKKEKQKRPSLHFKSWKRKNAFAII